MFQGQHPGWAGVVTAAGPPCVGPARRPQTTSLGGHTTTCPDEPVCSEVSSAPFHPPLVGALAPVWPHSCITGVTSISISFCFSKYKIIAQFYRQKRGVVTGLLPGLGSTLRQKTTHSSHSRKRSAVSSTDALEAVPVSRSSFSLCHTHYSLPFSKPPHGPRWLLGIRPSCPPSRLAAGGKTHFPML